MILVLPSRLASKICPMALLILCEPVWFRSSRLKESYRCSISREHTDCNPASAANARPGNSLHPDLGTPRVLGQPLGQVQIARPIHVPVHPFKLFPKRRVGQGALVSLFQLAQRVDQGFGDVGASESSESGGEGRRGLFLCLFGRLDLGQWVRGRDGQGRGDVLDLVSLGVGPRYDGLSLGNLPTVRFEVLGDIFLGLGVLDDGDDSGTDDDPISTGSGDGFVMRPRGHSEPDGEGDGRERLDPGDQLGETGGHVGISGRSGRSHLSERPHASVSA
jgi:hypothetical protein